MRPGGFSYQRGFHQEHPDACAVEQEMHDHTGEQAIGLSVQVSKPTARKNSGIQSGPCKTCNAAKRPELIKIGIHRPRGGRSSPFRCREPPSSHLLRFATGRRVEEAWTLHGDSYVQHLCQIFFQRGRV